MMSSLQFRDVTKRFLDGRWDVPVLDSVSFELDRGETLGVLASRGAGKTTLLRVAAGLEVPDQGEVCWQGRDLVAMSADERARARRRGGIALASGDWRAGDSIAVVEHVAMPLYSEGLSMKRALAGARRSLQLVQTPGLGYLPTARLGLVERVRVELARALVREPALLLVDEPAVLPQPKDSEAFHALLHSLPGELGITLMIASEEVSALRGSSRVMNLDGGRMHTTDSLHKVIDFAQRRARSGRGKSTDAL